MAVATEKIIPGVLPPREERKAWTLQGSMTSLTHQSLQRSSF